jgi:hypothetical protein
MLTPACNLASQLLQPRRRPWRVIRRCWGLLVHVPQPLRRRLRWRPALPARSSSLPGASCHRWMPAWRAPLMACCHLGAPACRLPPRQAAAGAAYLPARHWRQQQRHAQRPARASAWPAAAQRRRRLPSRRLPRWPTRKKRSVSSCCSTSACGASHWQQLPQRRRQQPPPQQPQRRQQRCHIRLPPAPSPSPLRPPSRRSSRRPPPAKRRPCPAAAVPRDLAQQPRESHPLAG